MLVSEKQESSNSESAVTRRILSSPTTAAEYQTGFRLFAIIFALLLSMFLIALDLTIIATAIPKITDEFHSLADIGWYAAAFFIPLAVFQSFWGRAYKHFKLKPVFLATVILFEVGSLICGVAQNSLTLILGRAIAGLGGAGVTGGIYTIIAFIVPPAKVPVYIGLIGAVFSIASVAGPLLGGVFTQGITWRWAFYINLPVGGVSILLLLIFFHTPKAVKPMPITWLNLAFALDIPGIVLALGLSICFTMAMQWGGTTYPWSDSKVIGMLVGFSLMTVIFSIGQWLSGKNAMLVLRFLQNRTTSSLCLFIFLLNAANLSIVYNLPQYFQIIGGASALFSGLQNLPMILITALATLPSGVILGRVGYYQPLLILGASLLLLGTGLIYTLDESSSLGKIIGYQLLVGVGVGVSIQVPVMAAQAFAEPQDIATVTSVILFFQLIPGALFVAATQAVLTSSLVSTLERLAPNLNAGDVLAVGATDIRNVYHDQDLQHILQAYMIGLKYAWAMSIGLAGLTLIASVLGERKSIRQHKSTTIIESQENSHNSDRKERP